MRCDRSLATRDGLKGRQGEHGRCVECVYACVCDLLIPSPRPMMPAHPDQSRHFSQQSDSDKFF